MENLTNRIAYLRALADLARETSAARSIVTGLLDAVSSKLRKQPSFGPTPWREKRRHAPVRSPGASVWMCELCTVTTGVY